MKICIIASLFDPYARGGAEVIADMVARELSREHEVVVITTDEWRGVRSLVPRVEFRSGLKIYRFFPANIFSFIHINKKPIFLRICWSLADLFNVHAILLVWRILRKERPDRVMVHALKGLTYGIAPLLNAMNELWSYTPHDVQLLIPSGRLASLDTLMNPFLRLYRSMIALLFASPPRVVFSSAFLRDLHREHCFFPRSERVVIPTPASVEQIREKVQESECVRFIFAGQLEEHKGVRELLAAFRSCADSRIRLTVMGRGRLEELVKNGCEADARISYRGYLSEQEKYHEIALHHYGIVCSKIFENAPAFISECLMLGVPVITVAAGGAAELIRDGENGFVVPRCDVSTLANALVRAANAPRYGALSEAARRSGANLSISCYCESLASVFEKR